MPVESIHTDQSRISHPYSPAVASSEQTNTVADTRDEQREVNAKAPSKMEISQSFLDKLQQDIKIIHGVGLQFSVHKATGRIIVRVIEEETGKLVREIPPHELLNLASKIQEMLGILFNQTA